MGHEWNDPRYAGRPLGQSAVTIQDKGTSSAPPRGFGFTHFPGRPRAGPTSRAEWAEPARYGTLHPIEMAVRFGKTTALNVSDCLMKEETHVNES